MFANFDRWAAAAPSPEIYGEWCLTKRDDDKTSPASAAHRYYRFHKDKRFSVLVRDKWEDEGTFTSDGTKLTLTDSDGDSESFTIKVLDSKQLVLVKVDKATYEFERVESPQK